MSFSCSYLYSLKEITPGLTQRISLVLSLLTAACGLCNTEKHDIVFKQCVGGKAKKTHGPNMHLFNTELKWIYYAPGLHPIGQEAVSYWHFLFSPCSELSVNLFVMGIYCGSLQYMLILSEGKLLLSVITVTIFVALRREGATAWIYICIQYLFRFSFECCLDFCFEYG